MNRTPLVLLVGLLVISAGCLGIPGDLDADPAADGTSDPGGTVDDSSSTDASSDDEDSPMLVENRTAALREAGSYTSTWVMTSTTDGEVVGKTTYTTAVDYANERSQFGMLQVNDDEVRTDLESYYADGTAYSRYGEDGTYGVDDDATFAPDRTLFSPDVHMRASGDLDGYTRVGTETYDGVQVTRYEMTEQPAWLAQQRPDEEFTWTSFTYVVLVDADGLVRQEGWTGEGVDDDGVSSTVAFSYSLTDVGSTVVDEPGWIDAAREQTGNG